MVNSSTEFHYGFVILHKVFIVIDNILCICYNKLSLRGKSNTMDEKLERQFQESEFEWAEIERLKAERKKKDNKIISQFCAANKQADMVRILELLEKHNGMPKHDKEIVYEFKKCYPEGLNVKLIHSFLDVKDIYSMYLEAGGDDNE